MRIFLSYASEDRASADAIRLALEGDGHDVFFDREDLPPGGEFHTRIRRGIEGSDLVIFLVSPGVMLSTVYIVNLAEAGTYGMAIAYASVLIVLMLGVITAIESLIGERRLRRRAVPLPLTKTI